MLARNALSAFAVSSSTPSLGLLRDTWLLLQVITPTTLTCAQHRLLNQVSTIHCRWAPVWRTSGGTESVSHVNELSGCGLQAWLARSLRRT
jgi:hypothetical protein